MTSSTVVGELNSTLFELFRQPGFELSLHFWEILKFFLPASDFSLTDKIPRCVHESQCFSKFSIDSRIVPEVLDVQVLNQLLLLLLAQLTLQELSNLIDDGAEVPLHVLVEDEEHVGMVPLLPGLLQVGEEGIYHQLVLHHPRGEGRKVPDKPMRLDESVMMVVAHHLVLGVPRHVDHLGRGEEAGGEKTEREM